MTTDTRVKEIAVEHQGLRVAGIVKGAGMIEPNVATMLCFLYTDADLPAKILQDCLTDAVEDSFNMLTVDGDTSTNDTVLLTATARVKAQGRGFPGGSAIRLHGAGSHDGQGWRGRQQVLRDGGHWSQE